MKKCAIVVDSSFNVTSTTYDDFYVIPLIITEDINNKITSYLDGQTITNEEICQKLQNNSNISTSTPPIGEFIQLVSQLTTQYDEIYCFTIPSMISSTYNNWKMAASEFKNVYVYDQTMVGRLASWTLDDVVTLRDQGNLTPETVNNLLAVVAKNRAGSMVIPDIAHLHKGGRIKGIKAAIAATFNLKLLVTLSTEWLRFRGTALRVSSAVNKMYKLLNQMIDYENKKIKRAVIFHSHINDKQFKIDEYITLIKEKLPNVNVELSTFPAVIVAHVGINYVALGIEVED